MWRSYIAQHKYRTVLDGIRDGGVAAASDALQAIRRLAQYQQAASGGATTTAAAAAAVRADVVQWFDEHQRTVLGANEPDETDAVARVQLAQWLTAAASVYYNEGLYETAVK